MVRGASCALQDSGNDRFRRGAAPHPVRQDQASHAARRHRRLGKARALDRGVAAVNHEFGAGYERRLIRGEEQDDVGDLFGRARALHRRHRGDRVEKLPGQHVRHRGLDHSGMHRVDADVVGCVVDRADLAQNPDRALGSVIRGGSRGTDNSVDGGNVDDRASSPPAHRRHRRLHPQPHALLIDRDDGIPFLLAGVFEAVEVENSGIVDEDVQSAELALRGFDRGAPVRRTGHIEMNGNGRARSGAVDLIGERADFRVKNVGDEDPGALAHEDSAFGGALSARASGDKSDFSLETVHGRSLPFLVVSSAAGSPIFDILDRTGVEGNGSTNNCAETAPTPRGKLSLPNCRAARVTFMEQVQYQVDDKNRYRLETPGHEGWKRTARPDDPDKYLMISADCHANEPGDLWRTRIDAKYRDRLPHVEVDANGEKWFVAEGLGRSRVRARMIADVPRENSEDRLRGQAGADPEGRIRDHLRDGIDAELIFPNKGLMMFATKDAEFGMAQCKVWNDFAWEMYGRYNDFMSPAAAIMTADVDLAIEEIKRVARIGFRFLTLPCKPIFGGHDSRDPNYNLTIYDPMWAVIQDCDLPITFHVSTGRDPRAARKEGGAVINYVSHSLSPTIEPVASLCGSGVIERFPKLKFAAVESGIGWVPWALDAMDEAYRKHHLWA